ncbi:MAG: DUF302 domain-containing protein [Salibacteraceae bacterium]
MNYKIFLFSSVVLSIISCSEPNNKEQETIKETVVTSETILQKVDHAVEKLNNQISDYKTITVLDHHRMAKEAGVYTPPSIATIFSNLEVELPLVQENQLIGLDLPFKVLCYAEPDTSSAMIAYTSAEFIKNRHNLNSELLVDYQIAMNQIIETYSSESISVTDVSSVQEGFGIVKIKSNFDYEHTVQNLREVIMSQGDTKWFADINYTEQASQLGLNLRPTVLLLFGGPAPGGKAMMTTPKIGLDAFCQKLLVFENEVGEVWIAYNDIVDFSKLYYANSTKPQQMINQRLKVTFTKAVTQPIN